MAMFAIEEIYDAAFDRGRFPALIERLCRAFGAQSGFIGWSDERDAGFQAQFGGDPIWLQRYVETYAYADGRLDVRWKGYSLPYQVFDKEQRVTHAAITENKRLGDVLAYIKELQDQKPSSKVKT